MSLFGGRKFRLIFTAILLIFIYGLPFYFQGYPYGHDIYYHFSRIQGSVELLKLGSFDFSVLPGFFKGFGYAVGLFYSTGILWIPIILVYLGINFITAYKILILVITILTLVSIAYTSFQFFKRWDAVFVTTVYYIFNVYRNYSDLYERAALGEYISFAFIPLIFMGLHLIFEKENKGKILLSIGMIGLILSHTISTMIAVILLFLYVLFNLKRLNNFVMKEISFAILITTLLTAFYWAPMIEMLNSDTFLFQLPWTHIWENQLSNIDSYAYLETALSQFPYGIEMIALLVFVLTIVLNFKKILKNNFLFFSTAMAILTFLLATSLIPANFIKILDFMQFPWRFFMFTNYFVSIVLGYSVIYMFNNWKKVVYIGILTSVMIFNYIQFSRYYINIRMIDYLHYDFVEWSYDVNGTEFLPSSVNFPFLEYYSEYKDIYPDHNIELSYSQNAKEIEITFDQIGFKNTIVQLPLIYYEGYVAQLITNNSIEYLDIYKDYDSMISINLGTEQTGIVKVFYQGTFIKRFSFYISVISLSSILCFYLMKVLSKKNPRKL